MYKLKWGTYSHKVNGSRVRYQEGDTIEDVPERHLEKWPDRFKKIEEEKNIDKLLDKYNEGYGWYKLPNIDRKIRKNEAIEILKEDDING